MQIDDKPTLKNIFMIYIFLLVAGCLAIVWGLANMNLLDASNLFGQVTSTIVIYMLLILVLFGIWAALVKWINDED